MKTIQIFPKATASAFIGAMMLLCMGACDKNGDIPTEEEVIDNTPNSGREKYIQRIEQYTAQDMATASSTTVFEYTPGKKLLKIHLTRNTTNGSSTSTNEYIYAGGKIAEVRYSESNTSYKTTTKYEYNGDRITDRTVEYNNGSEEGYRRFTYHEDDKYYEVREGTDRHYYYFTDEGDLRVEAIQGVAPVEYAYDNTKKGPSYAFRDDVNTRQIMAISQQTHSIHPRTKSTRSSQAVTYDNKYDKDNYLIESLLVGGTSYVRTVYTYD